MKTRSDSRQARERKFQPIVDIDDAVWRERLILRVLTAPPSTARLTIVTAPAGFGKTTMLAQLARHTSALGLKLAWLNCDARDRDPEIFSESLLAALAGARLSTRRKASEPVRHVAAHIARIAEPLAFFIDEYEAASSELVDDLVERIATAAPANVSIVLATRETPNLPLTQLQLAGKIRLIDADFLRFNFDETRSLLHDYLPDKAVHQVAAYAEGWPFALQLARLRAAGGVVEDWVVDPRARMPRRQIFDYLADEVFSTLKADTIAFLSEVAVLEALDVRAANAVRGRDDSLAFIRELSALKPIVVVDESVWSARLHPLLRDYLLDAMEASAPGRRAELHLRAARHFADQERVFEAVEHAVAGGSLELAARMIEEAGAILVLLSEGGLRVRALLQLLPPATVLRHLRLRILQIGYQTALGLSTGVEFERIERLVNESDAGADDVIWMELEMARSFTLITRSEKALTFSLWPVLASAKKLARERFAEDARPLCMCLAVEITMLHRYGPIDRVERRTAEIERIYSKADYHTAVWVWMYHVRSAYARGELDRAEQIIRQQLHQDANFVNYRPQFLGQIITVMLGSIFFQRGQIEQALAQFASIMPSESFTMFEILVGGQVDPAICEAMLGNVARARELLAAARHHAFEEDLPHLAVVAAATQIAVELAFGDADKAIQIADSIKLEEVWRLARDPFALPWTEVEVVARARFFLQLNAGAPEAALETADVLLALSLHSGHRLSEITALVMRSHTLRRLGRAEEAAGDLATAMAAAQKCGVVQVFVGFGADLMVQVRAIAEQGSGPASDWAAHVVKTWEATFRVRSGASAGFTPRELDVLCELAREQTTKMIAKALLLSPETVKQHLKAIFAKLGVGKREDAVAEARRRALMP